MYRVLIVDDELPIIKSIMRNLDESVYNMESATDGRTAMELIEKGPAFDVLVCDLMMADIDGFHILEHVKKNDPNTVFIMITAFTSIGAGIKAMNLGAYDFLQKPFDPDHLTIVIEKGIQTRQLKTENISLKAQLDSSRKPPPIIGNHASMKSIMKDVKKLSDSAVNILIEGESGTGKELLAKHIHYNSPMRYGPFIPIDCAAIPSGLLESELFGHEKGSFTGASRKKAGLMEVANNGTLFLDEINNLKPELQAKLLRALQEKSFLRVGGTQLISVKIRIMAASNKNLKQMVENNLFREDLYYRLKVVNFVLPPLRSRISDVPLLVDNFLEDICENEGKQCKLSEEAKETLKSYNWPGNVRELRNMLERMVALHDPSDVEPMENILGEFTGKSSAAMTEYSTELSLENIEYQHIMRVLEMTNWNKSESSKILNIDYTTLYRKLKKYGISSRPLAKKATE